MQHGRSNRSRLIVLACLVLCCGGWLPPKFPTARSWGFYAHKNISREASYALPQPLCDFFKRNIDYITLHSVDPDKRRFVDSTEAPHHFIDMDRYGNNPFSEIPHYWSAAAAKYTADTLNKYGTLPWQVIEWESRLTAAFKKMDVPQILRAASYLGHYVADAHVPLHTVTNYNGQKTEQQGIHALWESAVPQTFGGEYKEVTAKAPYIKNPEDRIWEIIHDSYNLAPAVLAAENKVRATFSDKEMYADKSKNKFSPAYIEAFNEALNGMVEKQFQASVTDVAAFWYTAWVNGGQPDVSKL